MKSIDTKAWFKKQIVQRLLILLAVMAIISVFGATGLFADTAEAAKTEAPPEVQKFGLLAAAIAFGLGALGAGIAISNVGAAAMGAIGEKPEIAGQALIFVALAEGVVVFGFITALMILGKV